jgi:hypothetical protein
MDNMKNKLFLLAAMSILAISCKKAADDSSLPTQDQSVTPISQSSVPAPVLSRFNTNFSGATQVEWFSTNSSSSSSSREFEVEFNHSGQRHDARYDDNGNERSHSISCTDGPVPQAVLTAFRSTHPNDNVYEWKLRSDGNWKAHFMRGAVKWETTYTATGVFVKEEQY